MNDGPDPDPMDDGTPSGMPPPFAGPPEVIRAEVEAIVASDFEARKRQLDEWIEQSNAELGGEFLQNLLNSLRDELMVLGADALEFDFPLVWKAAVERLLPEALRKWEANG